MLDYKDKLELLLDLGKVLSKEHNLDELLTVLTDITIKILNADRCSIFILDKEKNELWSRVAQGVNEKIIVPIGKGIAGYTAYSQEIQIVVDAYNDIRFFKEVDKKTGYKTENILTVPMINSKDETLGVFQVLNKKNGFFDNYDAEMLILLADYATSILENAILYDSLKEMNENLEKRVHEEVAKNREKDHLLIKQSKVIAVGELLGNIAHQWRQPLNVISLLVQDLDMDLEEKKVSTKTIQSTLREVSDVISDLSTTIDDFRTFFNPDKQKVPFLLEDAIESSIKLLLPLIDGNDIVINKDIEDRLVIESYKNELIQVFFVILKNSIEAILNKSVKKGKIAIKAYNENDETVITFIDNGGGISEEILDRLFEPYVTTKHKSQGTGIGLYMVKSVVELHINGAVSFENIEKGALFTLRIKNIPEES